MLQIAFKEWAVICEALAQGKQAIILRKGGIAEDEGEFGARHTRFWLYPTYVHQQQDGVNEETQPLLRTVEMQRPPAGKVRMQLWAEVTGIYRIRDELLALMLPHLHGWSEDTVRQRFDYRTPGCFSCRCASTGCRRRTRSMSSPFTPAAGAGWSWKSHCRRKARRRCCPTLTIGLWRNSSIG